MARSYDLVIVGMGTGGIVAADFATRFGLKVAAVERDRVGGDCLWTGCVPSKALLAAARAAHDMRTADRVGLEPTEPVVDTARVLERIRAVQAEIERTDDNPDRFRDAGVDVFTGTARLADARTVIVGDERLRARRILICTGSRPAVPAIPGLEDAGYLTTETIWDLDRAPVSLLVIGGGPVAAELAQGWARLGVRVTVLQRGPRLLPRDEPALVERLTARLRAEGVEVVLGADVRSVTSEDGVKIVRGSTDGAEHEWRAQAILVAAGRTPDLDGLGLEAAGVKSGPRGVVVDDRLRTSARSVYAVGDVAGRHLFTHSAGYEAATALRNMFFPGSGKAPAAVPWCTFTDPELAHAGLTEAQARERHGDSRVRTWVHDLSHSDRARTDAVTDGEIRLITARGRLVGAHVLAPGAGELIHELCLAIQARTKLAELGSLVHVYPTLSLGTGQLGGEAALERAEGLRLLVRSRA